MGYGNEYSINCIGFGWNNIAERSSVDFTQNTAGHYGSNRKGILIVPTTGRLNSLLPQSIVNINGICYAITSNGAVTYDLRTGKMIYSNFMNREVIVELLDLIPMDKVLVELLRTGGFC